MFNKEKKRDSVNNLKEGKMLRKIMNRVYREQKGITGLETAIILIAFVVVAAVFAYTVLSAGLFSTQKSQEAVYSGLEQTQSTLELKGAVIAKAEAGHTGAAGSIGQLTFTLTPVVGGEALDFSTPTASGNSGIATSGSSATNKIVVSYIDKDQKVENLYWTITKLGNADTDSLLENGEKFQLTVGSDAHTSGGGNLIDALTTSALSVNKAFTIEIKTNKGAVLTFERTTPSYIDSVMNLN
jgi:archaeal flagellin FlaB